VRQILGLLLILAGIILGLYIGLWLMFIGGIIGIINVIINQQISTYLIAINVVKIIFASTIGVLSFYLLAIPGYLMIKR
jgi:uncharacterized membrane protein